MKAISLWQPWATLVALRWKKIETRTHSRFKSLEGERIAIHAAKTVKEVPFSLAQYLPRMDHFIQIQNLAQFIEMCRGKIICTAYVANVGWAPNIDFDLREAWNKQALCDVAGKYLLFLDEIETLKKMLPFQGRQGIFNVADELIEAARRR